MKIQEVEALTGITKKNIRFYEAQGLLKPQRNQENRYREYTVQDVETLKQIKLLRRLDLPLQDILMLQKGVTTLEVCMARQSARISRQLQEIQRAKELCDDLQKQGGSLETVDVSAYLERMDRMERTGARFKDIAQDFALKLKALSPTSASFWFEPEEPIINKRDFTNEMIAYCNREGKDLVILHESMEPVVKINGVKYLGMLQMPRMLHFPLSIFFAPCTYGFRFAYFFQYSDGCE